MRRSKCTLRTGAVEKENWYWLKKDQKIGDLLRYLETEDTMTIFAEAFWILWKNWTSMGNPCIRFCDTYLTRCLQRSSSRCLLRFVVLLSSSQHHLTATFPTIFQAISSDHWTHALTLASGHLSKLSYNNSLALTSVFLIIAYYIAKGW